jgi:hypothetical protein
MRRIVRTSLALGAFAAALDASAAGSSRYQPEEVTTQDRATAESILIEPSPLPPAGIRAPAAARTRAITHGPAPRNLPIPPGAPVFLEPQLPVAATPPMPISPAPASSFLALGDDATMIPPDTQGAVGPDRLMVAANSQVRIQMRDGSVVNTYSLNSFFGSASGGSGVYDPVVIYDPYSSRWILVACDDPAKTTSALLLSASTSTNPDGSFRVFKFTADSTGVLWADRPHVGFNKDWVVIQLNMFTLADSTYTRSDIYVCPKTVLYNGGSMSCTWFKTTDIGGGQVPTRTLDSSTGTIYLVQSWNNDSSGTAYLALHSISGAVGAEVLTKKIGYPSTTATWTGYVASDLGPQSGTNQHIDLGDDRILDAVYRNGSIWAAHTVYLPAGGSPNRTAAQWWQFSTSGAVTQRGRIEDSSGVSSFAYPSLAVNKDNSVLLGFSTFSNSTFAGASYALRTSSDPLGTMQGSVQFKSGDAPYYKNYGGAKNRWGDYSATVVDPANDTDMWTIQEYAASPSSGTDRWSTWWSRVVPSSGGGSTCTPDSQTLCLASGRFKVQAAYRDYSGHTGTGSVQKLTDLSGYFYFFDSSNPEVLAKFVSFCNGSSGNWAIYASGLTDVEVTFKVTDTKTGFYKEYFNALGNKFCTIGDGPYTCP